VRAEAYAHLGISTLCRTNLMTTAVLGFAGQSTGAKPGIYAPQNRHTHAPDALDAAGADSPGGVQSAAVPATPEA
ncbi:MAG: hypothetical protein ABIR11_01160, partial [Candidatus Limnocylindrales bacterium]